MKLNNLKKQYLTKDVFHDNSFSKEERDFLNYYIKDSEKWHISDLKNRLKISHNRYNKSLAYIAAYNICQAAYVNGAYEACFDIEFLGETRTFIKENNLGTPLILKLLKGRK